MGGVVWSSEIPPNAIPRTPSAGDIVDANADV